MTAHGHKKPIYELAGKLQEPFTQSQNSPYWNRSSAQTSNTTQSQSVNNTGNMMGSGNQTSTTYNTASGADAAEDNNRPQITKAVGGSQPVTAILPTGGMVITQGKQVLSMPGRPSAALPASQLPTAEVTSAPTPSTPTPDIPPVRKPEVVLPLPDSGEASPLGPLPIGQVPPKTEEKKKGLSKRMIIIIAVVAVLLLLSSSAAAYFYMQKKPPQANNRM